MGSESTVGEVATFKNSLRKPVTASKREPGPYPYYGAAAIQDWVSGFLFEGLHLLVGEDGTVQTQKGRPLVQLVDGKFWVNNHAHVLVCDSDSDTRFLAYVLSEVQVAPYVTGAAQPKLNMGNLKRIPIRWPCEERRTEIAEIGKVLDDRIENLRQTSATLEAIAQALFKSWFVDFDPVRAKAEGREPEGMDAATAALFPSELEASELGRIPKGWRVGTSDALMEILGGGTPKTSVDKYWGGDIPWFSVADAPPRGQVFVLDTTKKVTYLGLKNCSAKLLPPMTTIISARGTVGKVAMTGIPMAMNQSCYGLRPKIEGGEAFVYFATLRFVEQLQRIAHGAVFDTITRESFKRIMTCLPSEQAIVSFGLLVSPLLERIRANGLYATTLASLRDNLLPRLISGQLRPKPA